MSLYNDPFLLYGLKFSLESRFKNIFYDSLNVILRTKFFFLEIFEMYDFFFLL
jgi:hypothetical protein